MADSRLTRSRSNAIRPNVTNARPVIPAPQTSSTTQPILSQLDTTIEMRANETYLTIIKHPGHNHAMLAVEDIHPDNKLYRARIVHLDTDYVIDKNKEGKYTFRLFGTHLGYRPDGQVKIVENVKNIKYENKSQTWMTHRDRAEIMWESVLKESTDAKNHPVYFYILGDVSFLSRLSSHERNGEPGLNCILFVVRKLREAGINLSEDSKNLFTNIADYTLNPAKQIENSYGEKEFCRFVHDGRARAIAEYFPPTLENKKLVNSKIKFETAGPVERRLGEGTLLTLACAYGKWDVVKLLVEKYDARITNETLFYVRKSTYLLSQIKKKDKDIVKMLDYLCQKMGETNDQHLEFSYKK